MTGAPEQTTFKFSVPTISIFWEKVGLGCWKFCEDRTQQWSQRFNVAWLWASICQWSSCAQAACHGHAKILKCTWTQAQPSERLPAAALPGSSETHTLYIYFYAYMCKLRCLGQTSQCPSAVRNVKRLTVQEPKWLCILQKSYSCSILVDFQRCSLCWPWEPRRFAFTRKNQRFSRCLPHDFLCLTHCFVLAQLTYLLHYASDGREHINIQGILWILLIFFITAIDIIY